MHAMNDLNVTKTCVFARGLPLLPISIPPLAGPRPIAEHPMAEKPDVHIGKFDIMDTYTYAKAILDGASVEEAERGMVAAIIGAKARLGHTVTHADQKNEAEEKKKKTITAESFDRQVSSKMRHVLRQRVPTRNAPRCSGRPIL